MGKGRGERGKGKGGVEEGGENPGEIIYTRRKEGSVLHKKGRKVKR